jgi:hypothetical protein
VADVIGLKFEFDLAKSVAVDGNGQITGPITPTLNLKAITPADADAYIDEFDAGIVSVNAGGNSFVIQGPFSHQFTVSVNQQTGWEGNDTINICRLARSWTFLARWIAPAPQFWRIPWRSFRKTNSGREAWPPLWNRRPAQPRTSICLAVISCGDFGRPLRRRGWPPSFIGEIVDPAPSCGRWARRLLRGFEKQAGAS